MPETLDFQPDAPTATATLDFQPDAQTFDFQPDTAVQADVLESEKAAKETEGLGSRIQRFFFEPEGAQVTREAIQGAVKAVPGMIAQFPKGAYEAAKFLTGGVEQQAQVVAKVAGEAAGIGRQTAQDIQAPFGTPEFLRGAGQVAMMAAPGAELIRELRGARTVVTPEIEKPPIQETAVEPPPVQRQPQPIEAQIGGTENAIEPSNAQVQEGGTPLGVETRPGGEEPTAGYSDYAQREAQGAAGPELGGTPQEAQGAVEQKVQHGQFGKEGYTAVETAPEPYTPEAAAAQKPSKIGKSIEAKAVEAKMTQGFAETAGYDPVTIADQAQRATAFVRESPVDARAVVRGEATLPEGLRGTSLITAMEEQLIRKPDPQLAYELANSPLTSATSAAAQEMRLMRERVPDSISAAFQEIRAARQEGSRLRGETPKLVNEIKTEIVRQSSKRPTWEAFVREITCA